MGMLDAVQQIASVERPLLLHTALRWGHTHQGLTVNGEEQETNVDLIGKSFAHDRHPFIALRDLLEKADEIRLFTCLFHSLPTFALWISSAILPIQKTED